MKKFQENLPLVVIALTIISAVYIHNYYKFVGINIFNYLETSEIIFLQFKLLVQSSFLLLFGFVSIVGYFAMTAHLFAPQEVEDAPDLSKEANKENKTIVATQAARQNITNWLDHPFLTIKMGIIFTASIWLLDIFFMFKSPVLNPIFRDMGEIGILAILTVYFNRFVTKAFFRLYRGKYFSNRPLVDEIESLFKVLMVIEMAVLTVLISSLTGRFSIYNTLISSTTNSATISFDSKSISTNDTLIYLGRTQKFIFLYHKIKEEAQIIPADKITQLDLRDGKPSKIIPPSYINPIFFKEYGRKTNKILKISR